MLPRDSSTNSTYPSVAKLFLSSHNPSHLAVPTPSQPSSSRLLRRIQLTSTSASDLPPDPTPSQRKRLGSTNQTHNHHFQTPQPWPTKPPTCHPPPTHHKTPAPTTHPNKAAPAATAPQHPPWAAQGPTALPPAKAKTTTAANNSRCLTNNSRCNTNNSPCTSSSKGTRRLRASTNRTIGAGVPLAAGSARESWARWRVAVVWIVCSRERGRGGSERDYGGKMSGLEGWRE